MHLSILILITMINYNDVEEITRYFTFVMINLLDRGISNKKLLVLNILRIKFL